MVYDGARAEAGGVLLLPTAARTPAALLLGALELHHADSARHCRLSATMVQVLARGRLPRAELRSVVLAALLHDVGKLGVDVRILDHDGPLSPADWQRIREHPVQGASLLVRSPRLVAAAALVRSHHERWDGGGYPDRLRGEEIPRAARLISIADALDCILIGRPYRPAGGYAAARFELEAGSGHQFDPDLVQAFLAVGRESWEELAEHG